RKQVLADTHVTGHVSFNVNDDGKYVLSVELHGTAPGLSHDETQELMQAAHEICPYSNATRGNIDVKLIAE
ncbi:MAG TPA: Organic hydroperoxide resistance protein OhrA, partial [Polyangiaceae bacterium]|nr:Organic hydroperoxide resistance protein OhrA [Polyangiaceae bacterium]